MGWRTSLSLVAVAGALLLVLLFTREKADDHGAVSVPLLGGQRLGAATRIQWQFAEMAPVELQRTPGGPFRLTLPVDDLASVAQLTSIAGTYDSATLGETPLPDTEDNRAKTGLVTPQCVLEIVFEGGSKQRLEIGAEGPLGTDVFVRRDGRIYRGGLGLLTALRVNVDDLRERVVFRTPVQLLGQLTVERRPTGKPRETLRLQRAGDGWQLLEPVQARADGGAAESFVRNVLGLRIDVFVDGPLALPEGPPDITVAIAGGLADERLELWRDTQENMVGRIEGRKIYFKSLNDQYYKIFVDAAEALRARVLVPHARMFEECVSLVVDPGGGAPRTVIRREAPDRAWELSEPITSRAEATPVNELISAIGDLAAVTFLPAGTDSKAHGIRSDGPAVSMQCVTDAVPVVVRLGDEGRIGELDVVYAARADGMTEVVAVPRKAVETIRRPWTVYVSPQLFHVEETVSRVRLAHRDGRKRELVRDDNGGWSDAQGAAVHGEQVGDTVERLRDLTAARVVLARTLGLGLPDWTLVMARRGDPDDPNGFGALEVWDRDGKLLVVHSRTGINDVAAELTPTDSRNLRDLWR
jgi:hypothetical protein